MVDADDPLQIGSKAEEFELIRLTCFSMTRQLQRCAAVVRKFGSKLND